MEGERPAVELSVIAACYLEERSIEQFHARLSATLSSVGRSYEIIYVDDGSSDGTASALGAIFARDPHVAAIVELFRNAGQAEAITAGTTYASGETFVFLDSDLQLDPEDLPRLLAEYDRGYDVVHGYRAERQDSLLRRLPSRVANAAMRRVARTDMRDVGCTFWIMNGRLVRGFEFGPFKPIRLPYLLAAAGRCSEVAVTHHPRPYGRSGWTFGKLLTYYVDSLVGVTSRPFQWLSGFLLVLGMLFVVRIAANVVRPFFFVASISNGLILNGVVLGFLLGAGISAAIGEYVVRSYVILLRQPAYVVRRARTRAVAAPPSPR